MPLEICLGHVVGGHPFGCTKRPCHGKPHTTKQRDHHCDVCRKHGSGGKRLIENDRLRVLTGITITERTCQHTCGFLSSGEPFVIKKRYKNYSPEIIEQYSAPVRMERLIVNESTEVLILNHNEVGGMNGCNSRYSTGQARVPPYHIGNGSSLVLMFRTAEDAELTNSFTRQLRAGFSTFVFDSKRAGFAPYCKIMEDLSGPPIRPCPQCEAPKKIQVLLDQQADEMRSELKRKREPDSPMIILNTIDYLKNEPLLDEMPTPNWVTCPIDVLLSGKA